MTPYTWLLLDVDGTLLDFRRAEAIALEKTPAQMGAQVPADFVDTYHAINDSLWREFEAGNLQAHEVRNERFRRLLERLGIPGESNAWSEAFLRNLVQASTFIEGAEALLAAAESHFGLVLLTNGFADVQRARIALLGLSDTFDAVIISEEVGAAKPHKDIFEIVFETIGRPDKARVLIVGDSLSSDIRGGSDYGIDTCWFNPDRQANETDIEPTYEIGHLNELTELLFPAAANHDKILRDRLRQAYDNGAEARERHVLPQWKALERDGFLSRLRADRLTRLLEVGAGTGRDSKFFADHGCQVTCIDLSPEMVRLCRGKGLEAQVMDLADLSFEDASFDAVYSFNSLLHLPKRELPSVLQEIRRVLRPGGLLYFGTWGGFDHEGIHEPDDHDPPRFFSFYGESQLQSVVSKVFDVLEFRSIDVNERDPRFRFQSVLLRKSQFC